MILKRISILNYKNLEQVELDFSPKMNCFIGQNGMGKTNLLDAVYYLSFCKSATNPIDSQNMMHHQDFFVIQGFYETESGDIEEIYCGMKRRRFMDVVISQYDKEYLEALIRYNKALQQRNTLLKNEQGFDEELIEVWEEMMAASGEVVYRKRCAFIEEFIPIFQTFYSQISQNKEEVGLVYESHAQQGALLQLLKESRQRDQIMGYSLKGIHKDDLLMQLGDYPIKKEGSQGQNKTYLIALKLAQFDFLRRTGSHTTPLLLLDDIFDKLDASRVEQIVKLVAGDKFGQIFITDTNRDHLDKIMQKIEGEYKVFSVEDGVIHEREGEEA